MHRGHESNLPPHQSDKSIADHFASYFNEKILKICNSFVSSDGDTTLRPPADPPVFSAFSPVTDEISKIISNSPTKSCLLDPWPTFLAKECSDILLPLITNLVRGKFFHNNICLESIYNHILQWWLTANANLTNLMCPLKATTPTTQGYIRWDIHM